MASSEREPRDEDSLSGLQGAQHLLAPHAVPPGTPIPQLVPGAVRANGGGTPGEGRRDSTAQTHRRQLMTGILKPENK